MVIPEISFNLYVCWRFFKNLSYKTSKISLVIGEFPFANPYK